MKRKKQLSALLLTLFLCCAMVVTVYAHEVPDLSRTGSISIAMIYDGEAVGGGSLTFYQAASVRADNGDYSFVLTDEFAQSGVSLKNPTDKATAERLAEYVSSNHVAGMTEEIGEDGMLTVENLNPGLYLVIQKETVGGFESLKPFLVSIPMLEKGNYVYDVDASPKLEILKKTPSPTPATPDTPDSTLPQTGQLNWPVPVLTILGLGFFFLGWRLSFGGQGKKYET